MKKKYYRYYRFFLNHLKNLANRRTLHRMLPLLLCIVGILVVLISVASMGGSNTDKISPADTDFYKKSRILVGVVPDNGALCTIDESGNATGYECELLRTILHELYPEVSVEFTEIDSQMASYELKHKNIDIAVGMFSKDVTKTQGLSLTVPYYTDGLYAYTANSGTTLAALQGHTVYLISTEYPVDLVKKAFSDLEIELELVSCSSYPDAVEAVNDGRAAAVVGMYRKMESKGFSLERIEQRIVDISYRILLWKDNSDVTALINKELNGMLEDGSLETLREKYGLETSKS